jgi:ATP-dependent protease HslVU (ClpYQ) ATPase subunit
MLFVGAGAFEKSKPTDLAIELQGRLPIKTKMDDLTKEDLVSILKSTEHNLLEQSVALLEVENLNIVYSEEAIEEMAQSKFYVPNSFSLCRVERGRQHRGQEAKDGGRRGVGANQLRVC